MSVKRRGFLRGAAASAGGLAVGGASGFGLASAAGAEAAVAGPVSYPFHGLHQAGILTPRQDAAAFVAFDLTADNRDELADLLRTVTERARWLTTGGAPAQLGISAPPSDSGVVGPEVAPDGLSLTLALGASAYDDRYGLASRRPLRLRTMETFPDDDLDRSRCDGDVLLQVCAHNRDTVLHALRDIARHTRGGMQARWRVDGFNSPPRPSGTPRNLLGFRDGTANPSVDEASRLIWAGAGEPESARGGSYVALRVIRMLVEFWDRVGITEQERMIGRRRDNGAPLSGSKETDVPDYQDDPKGSVIPLDAHIRVANPRTKVSDASRFLRRGYNYDAGIDSNGNLDMGLIFAAYQQDLERQFIAVQKRLTGEPLVDYISPVGGGYFFALPGARSKDDWLGRSLLA